MLDHYNAGEATWLVVFECHFLVFLDLYLLSGLQPLGSLLGSLCTILLFFLYQVLDSFLFDAVSKGTPLSPNPLYRFDIRPPFETEGFESLAHVSLVIFLCFFQRFSMLDVEATSNLFNRVLVKAKFVHNCLVLVWLLCLFTLVFWQTFRGNCSIENSFVHPEVGVDFSCLQVEAEGLWF